MPLQTQALGGSLNDSTLAQIGALSSSIFQTQGNTYFVNPLSGNDGNPGSNFAPLASVNQALLLARAGQNDIICLQASSNTAGQTTSYQNGLLNWNKDLVHLVGVNAGGLFSQRSRIAFLAGYNAATDLFQVSANGCLIQAIEFFMGVVGTLPTGCVTVSGIRNVFKRCHIAGMGNAANDISGAYSLNLKGAEECLFDDCTIGQDTIALGAGTSNSVLLFTSAAPANTRNWFRNCRFMLDTTSATVALFARGGGAGNIDRITMFEDCLFWNFGTTLTHAMAIVTAGGVVVLSGSKTGLYGASGWNANSAVVFATGGIQPTNSTWGLATALTS